MWPRLATSLTVPRTWHGKAEWPEGAGKAMVKATAFLFPEAQPEALVRLERPRALI